MARAGTIYLIHFARPLAHANHYLGWTDNLPARLDRHRSGNGSKLLAAVMAAGIEFQVVRTWPGSRDDERRMKNWKKARRLCPVCRGEHTPSES